MNRDTLMKGRRKALSIAIDTLDTICEKQTAENPRGGLCTNITTALLISMPRPYSWLVPYESCECPEWLMEAWIDYLTQQYFKSVKLNPAYPVEGSRWDYEDNRDKYNPESEFGRNRLKLAKGLANYLREIKWRTW